MVRNNGDGVPVEVHKEEGVYVPELIFGHLLTSSNYDDTQKKARPSIPSVLALDGQPGRPIGARVMDASLTM